ncbi:restriction endonuclease [Bacillus badius]|uniref:Restriction endonuclease type IV Mrr domain-containing protein n=1 Tax=Bacillus badius TaxID=1455 RepID=A0ABR5AZL3_BACBA|nr:restriction endonuclease [Bacillus badius]KIL80159.1 hypothetical protein SD77_0007 [Bacillus badius]MED4718399.1 hypothetical protein [Bacillus badius]
MNTDGFNYCCGNTHKVRYNIIHDPKPIDLMPELRRSIERMLWYVPGISSVQSYSNYLIDDLLYSEAVFEMIIETMNLSRESDVKIEINQRISRTDANCFANEICTKCQKMILTKYQNETILRSMLRHIRNAIAHGSFTVVDNLVLFIDKKGNNITSIIKTDILSLDRVLKQVEEYSAITQEKVLSRVFRILGYEVQVEARRGSVILDIILEKDGKTYGVEIKEEKRNKIMGYQDQMINQLIQQMLQYKKLNITPVFIFDKMRVSDKAKGLLKSAGVILLDRNNVSELLNKNDILS